MSNDLKAAGIGLLAANPGMDQVYMAADGQGFADKHDAEVRNDALGLKGKDGAAIKVRRAGNEKAIEAEVLALQEAHEAAVAASLVELAKIREEKKALKEAKKANRKGERVSVGSTQVLEVSMEDAKAEIDAKIEEAKVILAEAEAIKAENEALKAQLAELESKIEAPAPKKSNAKKK